MKIIVITRELGKPYGEIVETWGIDNRHSSSEIERNWRNDRAEIYDKWHYLPLEERKIKEVEMRKQINDFTLGKYIESMYGGKLLYFDTIDL